MKVRYTETALREVDEILSHIAEDNPLAADEVAAVLQTTIRRLSDYPRLAIETDDPSVRVMPVLPYRYLIFYEIAMTIQSLFATFASRRDNDLCHDRVTRRGSGLSSVNSRTICRTKSPAH